MKKFSFLIIAFAFIACSTETSNEDVKSPVAAYKALPNEFVRTVIIPNDSIIGVYNKIEIGFEGDREIIYGTNIMRGITDAFDLNQKTHLRTGYLNTDPSLLNVPLIETLLIGEDSILLFGVGGRVFLTNNETSVINKWNFSQSVMPNDPSAAIASYNSGGSLFLHENLLYIRIAPQIALSSDKDFYEKPFLMEYDIAANKITRTLGYFPAFMAENPDEFFYNEYQFSWLHSQSDKNKLLVSFRRSHDLMILDLETEEQKFIPAKSKFLDKFQLIPRNQNAQLDYDPIITEGTYRTLMYDSYRDVYYRIVTHNQDQINPLTNRKNNPASRPYSIIVLDKDLNYLGESTIEDYKKRSYLNVAVCSEGLIFIAGDDDESGVTFDILKILI